MASGKPIAGPSLIWLDDWKERRARERWPNGAEKLLHGVGPRVNIWHWTHKGPFAQCRCREARCPVWELYMGDELEPAGARPQVSPGTLEPSGRTLRPYRDIALAPR
jgi:hypothetical protein